jgi:hypothetical protein
MRIVLHIGLHKSGTSTVQQAWDKAFGRGKRVWYPRLPHGPSHALVAWWLRDKEGVPAQHPLTDVLTEADRRRTEVLLLSSEELHEATAEQCARMRSVLAGREVSLLITLTQPAYRWPSLWQEMVKHGWAAPQAKSVPQVDEPGVMGEGCLEGLVERWGIADTTICLVRQHPPEPRLVERLSDLMGLPLPARLRTDMQPVNASLGDAETRMLCEINRLAPDTRGIESARGRALFDVLREHGPAGAPRVLMDPDVVGHVAEVAAYEKQGMARLVESGRVRLDDAWSLLPVWGVVDGPSREGPGDPQGSGPLDPSATG